MRVHVYITYSEKENSHSVASGTCQAIENNNDLLRNEETIR